MSARGRLVLAVDAGGTSTRALVLTVDGRLVGAHRAAAGNPTSAGAHDALAHIRSAALGAVSAAGAVPRDITAAAVAMAGRAGLITAEGVSTALGLARGTAVLLTSDVLAMYHSAATENSGGVVVAGTGSVAAQVRDRALHRVVGGSGWLLGDGGSGFATGQRVARAVVADLDGSGPTTSMTKALLRECCLEHLAERSSGPGGRPAALPALLDILHRHRPAALARFAPLAFAAAADGGDAAALAAVAATHDELALLVLSVRPAPGSLGQPLVLGGSVWQKAVLPRPSTWSPALRAALDDVEVRPSRDGAVGAGLLALHAAGLGVNTNDIERLHAQAAQLHGEDDAPLQDVGIERQGLGGQ